MSCEIIERRRGVVFGLVLVVLCTLGGCPIPTGTSGTGATTGTGTTGTTPTTSVGDGDTSGSASDVPDIPYCKDVASWSAARVQFEERVVTLVNARRAAGAACGSEGTFGPAAALTVNSSLRCAARVQSLDMSTRGFFDHTNPDGLNVGDRATLAGYDWSKVGENIASGQRSADEVVAGWMNSPGHCANIMDPDFSEIGVGYYDGDLWTQVFGRPRSGP